MDAEYVISTNIKVKMAAYFDCVMDGSDKWKQKKLILNYSEVVNVDLI